VRDWQNYPPPDDGIEHSVVGTVRVLKDVESPQLGNTRDLYVYLPPSYDSSDRRYPVVYMHDGQNLFDRATSFAEEWQVDKTLEMASAEGLETIVVGVPNTGKARIHEYSPFTDPRGGGSGDHYLEFLVDTIKPIIDADFRTLPHRLTTGIAGSSMGGLISLYGFFKRPDIFGFAGVMSPALWFAKRAVLRFVERAPFVDGRIYIDCGTLEGYTEVQDVKRLRDVLLDKGYRERRDLFVVIEKGAGHDERAWARRLRKELQFLLRRGDESSPGE
jgi:predicted alpha/beta superfamily hydrolase